MTRTAHPKGHSYLPTKSHRAAAIRDLLSPAVTDACHLNFRKRCRCQRLPRSGRSFRPPASPNRGQCPGEGVWRNQNFRDRHLFLHLPARQAL